MPKKKLDTAFEDWITTVGIPKISKKLNIRENTVLHWLHGRVLPQSRLMKEIKKMTKGKVGYDQIIEGSCSPLK